MSVIRTGDQGWTRCGLCETSVGGEAWVCAGERVHAMPGAMDGDAASLLPVCSICSTIHALLCERLSHLFAFVVIQRLSELHPVPKL